MRVRRDRHLAPHGHPLLAARPAVTVDHLLHQGIEAVRPALRGVRCAQTVESVAVVKPAERDLSWQATVPRGVVRKVRALHHRERAPVALLEGEGKPALRAIGGARVGVKHRRRPSATSA